MSLRPMVFCLCCMLVTASTLRAEVSGQESEPELRTFQLVLVRPNPDFREPDSPSERLAQHRKDRMKTANAMYLDNLVKDQVALVAGPLPENDEIQQIAILDRDSMADAEFVFKHSPAVTTGRLKLEYYSFTAVDGVLRRPEDPHRNRIAQIGLLYRPDRAPRYPKEKLEEIEAGHRAHLEQMLETGELVIAGEIDRGDDLEGVLIFRARTADRIEEFANQDPAIKAGRLRLELNTWEIAPGSWPRPSELGIKPLRR